MSEDMKLYKENVTTFIRNNSLELIVPFSQQVTNTDAQELIFKIFKVGH